MRLSRVSIVLALTASAACGGGGGGGNSHLDGGGGGGGDGQTPVDAPPDALVLVDAAPTPTGCDYSEQLDQTNDDQFAAGSAEPTGLTLGSSALVVCGNVNAGHFDSTDGVADSDGYTVNIGSSQDVLVEVSADGGSALQAFSVVAVDSAGDLFEADYFNDHAATSFHTGDADTWEFEVTAFNGTAITDSSAYRIHIIPDDLSTRCGSGAVGVSATYVEAHDGSGTGNDMVDVNYQSGATSATLTASTTDSPENTALTVGSDHILITGTSAVVTPRSTEDYLDEDTYQFTTGPNTNQVAIRADWTNPGSDGDPTAYDYDWFLFDENSATIVAESFQTSTDAPEANTVAVQPSTTYWLWVAPFNNSGSSTDPDTTPGPYTMNVCGESFTGP